MEVKLPVRVEMNVFSKTDYNGTSTSIHLIVPIANIDFDMETKNSIYTCWLRNHCLPSQPQFDEANNFIKAVTSIAGEIEQIVLGTDFLKGNHIELVISKQGSAKSIVKRLQWLIKPKATKES